MKRILTLLPLVSFACVSLAQQSVGGRVVNRTKEKTINKTEQKIDEKVDNTIDKIFDGSIFRKKDKNAKGADGSSTGASSASGTYDPAVTPTDKEGNTDYSAYRTFDFVPGEKILFFDDFADGSISRWGFYEPTLHAAAQKEGKVWLEAAGGRFFPVGLDVLPRDFTLEFDAQVLPNTPTGTLDITFVDKSQRDRLGDPYLDNSSLVSISPISQMPKTGLGNYEKKVDDRTVSPPNEFEFYSWQPELNRYNARISMARSGNRLAVFVNKEQVLDDIDFFDNRIDYMLLFHLNNYFVAETRMYFTDFRLASGAAQPKAAIAEKKVFVTQNIYFDVDSDVIRPNSYAVLKEIAEAIADVEGTIKIIGHTDSDGSDQHNLALSKKRAASVKRALANEFGVAADKLIADGMGESQPLNGNASPAEKAQNRRVEFIQQ